MEHTYYTLNGKVVRESYPHEDTTIIMHFFYDEQGRPFGLRYSKDGGSSYSQYYYALNAQGDVEGIFSTMLNQTTGLHDIYWMGHYEYDAWGNFKVIAPNGTVPTNPAHLMNRNPLRYRGYYYDTETGFYYLQSRYYDPVNHRFINADSIVSTGQGFTGTNMFAYCLNNPVRKKDISGAVCENIFDGDGNPITNDDKRFDGKSSPTIGGEGSAGCSNSSAIGNSNGIGKASSNASSGPQSSPPHRLDVVDYAGKSGKTDVHHVVEQCQGGKSGFNKSQIQSDSNKIELDRAVHQKVSGYYSSKTYFSEGLRIRDWLAGQSFEAQTAFGWSVVNYYYYLIYK